MEKKDERLLSSLSKQKIITIEKLTGIQLLDNFWFEIDMTYAPRKIPLDTIHLDLQNFQNRKKPYSENSVNNIVEAVLSWKFDLRIFDRVILRRNSDINKIYVLSWHSRLEAFSRLSTQYKDHDMVKQIEKKFNFSFSSIYWVVMDNITFDDARFIALMSNALATIETDIERADIYRTFREIGQKNKFIEEFGRKCEKSNRPRIDAYSFLNRNWLALQALESFESNQDDSNIIKRICLWIWNIRKKYPELSDLHENELTQWLLEKGWYGNKAWQVNCQNSFLEIVGGQIHRLKENWEFGQGKMLNILKLKSLSFSMKQYYYLLNQLREKKKTYYIEFNTKRRDNNKRVVKKAEKWSGFAILQKHLLQEIKNPIDLLNKIEQTEFFLFDLEPYIDDSNIAKITDKILEYINKIEQDYYRLQMQKEKFLESGKNEIELWFQKNDAESIL